MKIRWKKTGPSSAEGYVGEILCFFISREMKKIILICDLPNASKKHYGRTIAEFKTAKEAAKAANVTLKSWLRRFNS